MKWEACRKSPGDEKYIICNADEGDPGAYMDRSVLEGDPHTVLEGMLICGYAIGSSEGYIYIRAEYPLAIEKLMMAIKEAEEYGLLGKNILNKDFDFTIKINEGDQEITFNMKLPSGKFDMEARLIDKDGKVYPSYFVYIEKL